MAHDQPVRKIIDREFLASVEMLELCIKSGNLSGGRLGGARRSTGHGSSIEWKDYREYIPGDDLRRIDWNLAARFDKYYIKHFLDERQLQTNIYIDQSGSMDWRDDGNKGVAALRLAVAIGYLAISSMDRVSFRLLQENHCTDLCGSILDKDAFMAAALQLSLLEFKGTVDLDAAVRSDLFPGFENGMSYIISDFLTESSWKNAVEYLLSRHRDVTLLQVLSPGEAAPVTGGSLMLFDAEVQEEDETKGLRMDVDRSSLQAYTRAAKEWVQDMEAFCKARNVLFMTIRSDERMEDVILKKGVKAGVVR